MPQFIMTYHGGSKPATPEEGQAHMQRYMEWIGGLDAIVPQQPLKGSEVLGSKEITTMMGYSIINAPDMDAARAIAQSCPFLDMDDSAMQLSELMVMG
ncbi:YciI family protein [Yoonia sp.]|uniref:hypothetical protein n=1 Tax=Yoonia sp. TaxID=2212373 RepID=UPI0023707B07|nr:hypothetical protein [Yoonia sp.]MDB4111848.1 YciI family protein [Yoonia sp.]